MLQRAAQCIVSLLLPFAGLARAQEPSATSEATVLVPDTWMSLAQRQIAHEEYQFSPLGEPGVWSAPNRSQGLRSRAHGRGIDIFPRSISSSGENAPWTLRLGTASFGRGGEHRAIDCLGVSAAGPRVLLDHGPLVEWFQNSEKGIEHGWTVRALPSGSGPLEVMLSIEGGLSLRIDGDGASGLFVTQCGEARLRYKCIRAVDAAGRSLVLRLVPRQPGVVVEVIDDGAVYPLNVDLLLTNSVWSAEGSQAGSLFGMSVATAGDVNGDGYSDVLVGAPQYDNGELNEGRAFLYYGSSTGLAATEAWTAESDQADAFFGTSLATAGDVNADGFSDVIIGAPRYDNGEFDEGRAYAYYGSPSGLSPAEAWTAESNLPDALYGTSLSTAGDVNGDGSSDVIVGAPTAGNGQMGRAYVYNGSTPGLSPSESWTADGDQADSLFGSSVSSAGDVNADGYFDVIVGAPAYDNAEFNAGRAYVYQGSPSGLSSLSVWMAEVSQPDAGLGLSVSTAGDVNGDGYSDVIVGAHMYDDDEVDEGRVLVYQGSALGLSPNAAWTVDSNQAGAELGASVATAGDVNGDGYSDVLVGASQYDESETDEGRAYLYLGSAAGLSQSPTWMAESDQTGAQFGVSVSTAGDVNADGYSDVIVGAGFYDVDEEDNTDEGRAYAYFGSGSGPPPDASWMVQGNQAGAGLGYYVSSAGDVNGDGFSDVIVAAYFYDNGQQNEGRVYVYHGSGDGLSSIAAWATESNQAYACFGYRVSTAGDVNGDGYSDVLVGAYQYNNGGFNRGRAYAYLGSPAGLSSGSAWTVQPGAHNETGISVSTAGDVNGDGYSDVIIGTPNEHEVGQAYVYLGSATGLSQSPAWMAESDQTLARFGWSVSTAGDVNGDGYSDVIVGAPYFWPNSGRTYVYYGSSAGLSTTAIWTAALTGEGVAYFGTSVATAGDVNGDGYSDVIVGAPDRREGVGGAYAYLGSAAGLSTAAIWMAEADSRFARYGFSVSAAGDVNGDGYSDVIVGAPSGLVNGVHGDGTAQVYLGSASGLSVEPSWVGESNVPEAAFGWSVAAAGDVNGDGYSDVIVGEISNNSEHSLAGRAFLYLGNNGAGGLIRALQQRTGTSAKPISLYGQASAGLFRLRARFPKNLVRFSWATAESPVAWLEWEVRPFGQVFDGTDIDRGTAQTLASAGGSVVFDELVDLESTTQGDSGAFHWRVRVATNNPLFPHTSWFSVPGSNITEAKLRASAESRPRTMRPH